MPIRVEHGPNLAPVGQLAYQTGQLEYRNKRRSELERLAMQQAEMRQRAAMQQRQLAQQAAIQQGNWGMDQQRIVANVQQNKQAHDNAMARLAQAQKFGVVNNNQANQWAMAAAEEKREHDIFLADKSDQAIQDRAAAAAGLADQSALKRMGQKALVDAYKNTFNPQGQQFLIGQLGRIDEINGDTRTNDQQKQELTQKVWSEITAATNDIKYTSLGPDGIGSETPIHKDSQGRPLLIKRKTGEDTYEYVRPLTWDGEEKSQDGRAIKVTNNWDPAEYERETHQIVDITDASGKVHKYQKFLDGETGQWEYTQMDDNTLEIAKAYGDYVSDFNSNTLNMANQAIPMEFDEWKRSRGFGGQAPVGGGDQVVPVGGGDQVVPLDDAAQAEMDAGILANQPQVAAVHEDGTPVPGAPVLPPGQLQLVAENPQDAQGGVIGGMRGPSGQPGGGLISPAALDAAQKEAAGQAPPQNLVFDEETRHMHIEGTQGNPRQVQNAGDRDMMILNGTLKVGDSYELPPAPDGAKVVATVTEEMIQNLRSGGQ